MKTKDCDRYIDRPFNIRPICFWAFFVGLTVVVCGFANRADAYWVIVIYFAMLVGGFFGLQFVKSKDNVITFLGTSRLFFCGTVVLCLVVVASFALVTFSHTNQKSYAGYKELGGVVEIYKTKDDGSGYFVISSAKFGGSAIDGRVMVFAESMEDSLAGGFNTFDKVCVITQLRVAVVNDYYINNGIKYTASIRAADVITVTGKDNGVRSTVLGYSNDFLGRYLSEDNAELMYSMLFGDKNSLDGEIRDSFALTSLAHVLSVSGLHVGLIIVMLMFVLNLLRVSRKKQLYVIFVVLLVYCYLCGFQYAILRASIMFLVFAARRAYARSTDMLSSLCLSAIIILILFPFSLYSVSFQLSFACMFGIALFNLPFKNFFLRYVKSEWLATALSMYFATTIACLPFMIKYFGLVSVVGVLANIIVMPVIVIVFQACVVSVVTWIAFPILYLMEPILTFALAILKWMADLPIAVIKVSGGGGDWALIFMLGLILMSRFIFAPKKYKYSAAAVMIAIYSLSVIL